MQRNVIYAENFMKNTIQNVIKKKNTNGFMFLNLLDNQNYFEHDPYDCCPECMTSIRNCINALGEKKGETDDDCH